MKPKLLKLFSFIAFLIITLSCNKDEQAKDYLDEGYISFSYSGKNSGYEFNKSEKYTFYKIEGESKISKYGNQRVINMVRYSKDFQNKVILQFTLDASDKLVETFGTSYVGFRIFVKNQDNTMLLLEDQPITVGCFELPCPETVIPFQFKNLKFDKSSNSISGEFSYSLKNYIEMSGNFDVKLTSL